MSRRDEVRVWLASINGRLQGIGHVLRAHRVDWQYASPGAVCHGDIACVTCSRVLWCRAFDAWSTVDALDLWESGRPGADDAPCADAGGRLELRLNQLLGLADRMPRGEREDAVRRSVCELIEAEHGTRQRHMTTLIRRIAQLQHDRSAGLCRPPAPGAAAASTIDRLAAALTDCAPSR